jgi:hypothetical protein
MLLLDNIIEVQDIIQVEVILSQLILPKISVLLFKVNLKLNITNVKFCTIMFLFSSFSFLKTQLMKFYCFYLMIVLVIFVKTKLNY